MLCLLGHLSRGGRLEFTGFFEAQHESQLQSLLCNIYVLYYWMAAFHCISVHCCFPRSALVPASV